MHKLVKLMNSLKTTKRKSSGFRIGSRRVHCVHGYHRTGLWEVVTAEIFTESSLLIHRSDSIQGTDYIATPIQGFLG